MKRKKENRNNKDLYQLFVVKVVKQTKLSRSTHLNLIEDPRNKYEAL